jgi:hypothetical protein
MFVNLYKKLTLISEESTSEKDDKAEKAAKKVAKDIEYDDKKDEEKKLDEWANDAGKDGTEQAFQRDIDFMTQVISGGLNGPKKDQTTLPHTAVKVVEEDADMIEWKRLAGLR